MKISSKQDKIFGGEIINWICDIILISRFIDTSYVDFMF